MASNNGCTRSTTAASPAAMMLSLAAAATSGRPNTVAAIGNVVGVMRGDQRVDAIKRNGSHVHGNDRRATMFEQITFDEDLAQGLVIRQHRNDRVAPKSIGRGRSNVGAGPFQFVQWLG